MSAGVRRLGPGDLVQFRDLNALFADVFEEPGTYLAAQPDDAYVRELLASRTFVALVRMDGDLVVGGLAGYLLPKFEQARSELYIYDLAVAETHRRQGIATALIEALRPIAREAGAHTIFVQADYGDEPAVALYTKLGTREDVLHFDISPMPRDV